MLKRIYIEISNICNVQCSFCPVVGRDKSVLSVDDFQHILRQACPLAEEVCLHLMGEPLAHPQFAQILQSCAEVGDSGNGSGSGSGMPVQITTNGLLLKKYQQLLLDVPVVRQINFSLQSFPDNFPHKQLDSYLESILQFALSAQEKRPEMYINLRLWNLQGSLTDIKTNSEAEVNEKILKYIENFLGLEIKRGIDVGNIKSKRIWHRLYLHFDSRFEWPSFELPYRGKVGTCHALSGHVGIHADGTVVPCCLDKEASIPLGNCLNENLQDILQGERAERMRQGFKQGVLVEKLCQHCSYIQRFQKKVPAQAHLATSAPSSAAGNLSLS